MSYQKIPYVHKKPKNLKKCPKISFPPKKITKNPPKSQNVLSKIPICLIQNPKSNFSDVTTTPIIQ